ncbi:MAG: hypothetical protein AB8B69_16940 [Chitinophagales bacterium]
MTSPIKILILLLFLIGCKEDKMPNEELIGLWQIIEKKENQEEVYYSEWEFTKDKIYLIDLFKAGTIPIEPAEKYSIKGDSLFFGGEFGETKIIEIKDFTSNSFKLLIKDKDFGDYFMRMVRVTNEKEKWSEFQEENDYTKMCDFQKRYLERMIIGFQSKKEMDKEVLKEMRENHKKAITFFCENKK